jgi:UDP-N-acetylmuramyl pentapeptide synthase
MDFLLSIAKPDIGIITKIDAVHSTQFESKEIIAQEKYSLLIHSKQFVLLNTDDDFYSVYVKQITVPKYYFST